MKLELEFDSIIDLDTVVFVYKFLKAVTINDDEESDEDIRRVVSQQPEEFAFLLEQLFIAQNAFDDMKFAYDVICPKKIVDK